MGEDLSVIAAASSEERAAWCKAPVPRSESLEALFGDLGIRWFLCGIPFGGYGIDWGFWEAPGEFEANLRSMALLYADEPEKGHWTPLYHATGAPRMTWSKLSNCEMGTLACGEIKKPEVVVDGLRYTFDSAMWRDGAFVVRSRVSRVKAVFDSTAGVRLAETPIQEREDAVAALRVQLCVVALPPPVARVPWYRRLARFVRSAVSP